MKIPETLTLESVYRLFQGFTDEIPWATGVNNFVPLPWTWARTAERYCFNAFWKRGTLKEWMNSLWTTALITDPGSGYTEAGFQVRTMRVDPNEENDEHISNMYANREPRFYQAVTYEGRSWYQDLTTNKLGSNYRVFFSRGGGADNTSQENPRTGYMLNKFKNRSLLNQGTNIRTWGRPWILFRLGDFYLYYAEVLNEINPSDPLIIEYLDKIRERNCSRMPGARGKALRILLETRNFSKPSSKKE